MEPREVSFLCRWYKIDPAIRKIRPCRSIIRHTGSSVRVTWTDGTQHVLHSRDAFYHVYNEKFRAVKAQQRRGLNDPVNFACVDCNQ